MIFNKDWFYDLIVEQLERGTASVVVDDITDRENYLVYLKPDIAELLGLGTNGWSDEYRLRLEAVHITGVYPSYEKPQDPLHKGELHDASFYPKITFSRKVDSHIIDPHIYENLVNEMIDKASRQQAPG